jgi:hypothetical protein
VIANQKADPGTLAFKENTSVNQNSTATIIDAEHKSNPPEQAAGNKTPVTNPKEGTGSSIDHHGLDTTTPVEIDLKLSMIAYSHEKPTKLKNTKSADPLKQPIVYDQSPAGTNTFLDVEVLASGKARGLSKGDDLVSNNSIHSLNLEKPGNSPDKIDSNQVVDSMTSSVKMSDHAESRSFINELVADIPEREDLLQLNSPAVELTDTSLRKPASGVKNIASKRSTWSVDISISPFIPVRQKQGLSSVNRTSISSTRVTQYVADTVKSSLQPSFAYTIAIKKKLNKRLMIGAGIQYGVIKEHLKLRGRETNTDFQVVQRLENGVSGPILKNDTIAVSSSGTRTIDAINSYRFFDIPLYIQYILVDKGSLSLSLTGGINLGLYSRYNNSINGDLQVVYNSVSAAHSQRAIIRTEFFTGFRLSQQIFKGCAIFAEPYLRFNAGKYANTIINNKSVHQAGIGVGVEFQIGGRR